MCRKQCHCVQAQMAAEGGTPVGVSRQSLDSAFGSAQRALQLSTLTMQERIAYMQVCAWFCSPECKPKRSQPTAWSGCAVHSSPALPTACQQLRGKWGSRMRAAGGAELTVGR